MTLPAFTATRTFTCMQAHEGGCKGVSLHRMPLSGTGKSFVRCDAHWSARLDLQREIDERYPCNPPADWSPLDCGETWDDEG